jgi:hypothetical protein
LGPPLGLAQFYRGLARRYRFASRAARLRAGYGPAHLPTHLAFRASLAAVNAVGGDFDFIDATEGE